MNDRDTFLIGCNKLDLAISNAQIAQIDSYVENLQKWNKAFNLIGGSTVAEVYKRHVLDCAQVIPLMYKEGENILDVGSGAGLPAIIIAIMTGNRVSAVEKSSKKCQFLAHMQRTIGIRDRFTILNSKVEDIPPSENGTFSMVTSRAFAKIDDILGLTERLLSSDGKYILLKSENETKVISPVLKKRWMTSDNRQSITNNKGRVVLLQRST